MKPSSDANTLSPVVIALLKGVVWREDQERLWHQLLSLQARVRDHVEILGLTLEIDEAEGFALLRQAPDDEERALPRLVARRPLSFPASLLLVLLRKKIVETDGLGGDRRVVLRRSSPHRRPAAAGPRLPVLGPSPAAMGQAREGRDWILGRGPDID